MLGERIELPGDDRWDYHHNLVAAAQREFDAGRFVAAVEIRRAADDVADDLARDAAEALL